MRLETQFRQVFREAPLRGEIEPAMESGLAARLLTDWIEGRMHHYRRSTFTESPLTQLEEVWKVIAAAVFHPE